MIHFGDVTKLDGHDLPIVDVVTGGVAMPRLERGWRC